MPTAIGPITTGQASTILGLTSRVQIDKLIGAGLLPVVATTTGGGRRHLDSAQVLDLASWTGLDGPGPGGGYDLAVHLAPLQRDSNHLANQRTHHGYHVNAAAQGLNVLQIQYAWAGLWNCNPGPYVGSNLVGDVSGFVVCVAPIFGYRIINKLVRFDIGTPSRELEAHYLGHRIKSRPGAPFQAL